MILSVGRVLIGAAMLAYSATAMATTFGFDAVAPTNASVPLSLTVDGLTASLSSPSGAGAFIAEDGSAFSTLGSSVLGNDNFVNEELDIAFSQALSVISFQFATNDSAAPTSVTLTETLNGRTVGSATAIGSIAASGLPEGGFSLAGTLFDGIRITDLAASNAGFAIGAVTVPEPSTMLVAVSGLLGLMMLRRRYR